MWVAHTPRAHSHCLPQAPSRTSVGLTHPLCPSSWLYLTCSWDRAESRGCIPLELPSVVSPRAEGQSCGLSEDIRSIPWHDSGHGFLPGTVPHTAPLGWGPLLRESQCAFLSITGNTVLIKNCISQTQIFTRFKNLYLNRWKNVWLLYLSSDFIHTQK